MGKLAIKPDGDGDGPKLSDLERARGEVKDPNEKKRRREEEDGEDGKMMRILCIEIDATYLRTIPGFLRLVKVLLLVVGAICLVSASEWGNAGVYGVYCIILITAASVGGYLLLTKLMGDRTDECCGFNWVFLEFLNFAVLGFLVFIGACLAAANSDGSSGLSGSAAFGFFAVFTYVYLVWHGWGAYRSLGSEEAAAAEEGKSKKSEQEEQDPDHVSEPPAQMEVVEEVESESPPMKNRSLPADLNHMYENTNFHRSYSTHSQPRNKRHSLSEKDSAYSEPEDPSPHNNDHQPPPHHHQRKSATRWPTIDHVLQRQPLAHMSHRPYSRGLSLAGSLGRSTVGYPSMVSEQEEQPRAASKFDDLHRSKHRSRSSRGGAPEWLRAAMAEDTPAAPDHVMDDDDEAEADAETEAYMSRVTSRHRREFPLLNDSAEESVCYPSISQQPGGDGLGLTMVPNPLRRSQRRPSKHFRRRSSSGRRRHHHHHHVRAPGHHHRHRGGHHRRHGSGGRRRSHHGGTWHHGSRPRHHHHHGQHPHHNQYAGRRPLDGAHQDYLRQVMGNDELVDRDAQQHRVVPGAAHPGNPISTSPVPNGMENPVMQKYFSNIK